MRNNQNNIFLQLGKFSSLNFNSKWKKINAVLFHFFKTFFCYILLVYFYIFLSESAVISSSLHKDLYLHEHENSRQ